MCVLLQVLRGVYDACETHPDAARVAAVVTLLSDTLHALRAGQPLPAGTTTTSASAAAAAAAGGSGSSPAQLPVAWEVRRPPSARLQLKFSQTDTAAVLPVLPPSLEEEQEEEEEDGAACTTADTGSEAWLHAKLMSPERKKKSPLETARMVEEKQRRAERTRERYASRVFWSPPPSCSS
jgi:hypothetical protein